MEATSYTQLLPIIILGVAFFVVTIVMLFWSAKKGHLRRFDAQAKTIFTEEEPEGEISDKFPESSKTTRGRKKNK